MGKVATSPLPSRGSPPLQSGGQNQKWPTCGQSGYITPAVLGIPTAREQGEKSEVTHLLAKWLCHPCRLRDPHRCRVGGKIRSGPLGGKVATSPQLSRGPHRGKAGDKVRSGPQVGKVAKSPLPSWRSPLPERGAKSGVAHKWAKCLRHTCRHGDPQRFKEGGKIRSGPQVGKLATSPLTSRASPPLESGGEISSAPADKVAMSPLPSRGSQPL